MMMRIAAIGVAAMTLVGCSVKTYPNTLPKNMHVTTKLDSGSMVKGTSALLDVYRVDAKCELTHEGRLDLEEPKTDVGLPINSPLYLEFIFVNSNYLARSSSSTNYGLLLTPRPGNGYQVKAQYASGIYDVVVRESGGRVIGQVKLSDCRPGK